MQDFTDVNNVYECREEHCIDEPHSDGDWGDRGEKASWRSRGSSSLRLRAQCDAPLVGRCRPVALAWQGWRVGFGGGGSSGGEQGYEGQVV